MIKGKNVFLRAVEPSDINLLYSWENNTEIWRVSETISPFSRHLIEQYTKSVNDIYTDKQLRLMICRISHDSGNDSNLTDHAVGCIDLFDFDPRNMRAGVGILIADKRNRRKGYAEDALRVFIDYSFNVLHVHQLYCNISIDNEASINLFRKQNFKIIGLKREWIKSGSQWVDEHMLQLINPSA